MKLKIYITALLAAVVQLSGEEASAQTQPGFVQQDVIKVTGTTTSAQVDGLSITGKITTRVYYDGLNRPLQTVGVQASPLQNDIIQPVAYDNLGRQTTGYLPYGGASTDVMGSYRSNALPTAQAAFYNQTTQHVIPVDNSPYSQQVFENSPLQRLLNSGMVGNGYQPGVSGNYYKTIKYRPSGSTDGNIMLWTCNTDGTYSSGTAYAANSLAVTDGTDENGAETLTFTDLAGHMILKRQILSGSNLDTYYIYNNAGMIAYVVPPQAFAMMVANNNYDVTQAGINKLTFHYVYDAMGRLVEKTVPAKGTVYIVYDSWNRPVLMQDANMLGNNQWNYIRYDAKNRVISQGIYTDGSRTGRVSMQAYVNGITPSYETRTGTQTNYGYYTCNAFPTTTTGTIAPLAYAYYDDYYMTQQTTADFGYAPQGDVSGEGAATAAQLKGTPTIICKTTIGAAFTNTWLTTVMFYDRNLHLIQARSNNHVYYTGFTASSNLTDTKTTGTDFTGTPIETKVTKQTGASTTVTVYTSPAYDQVYRITGVSQKYNSGSFLPVAHYSYSEAGQLVQKGLGYSASTTYLQLVDMRYNIRGQLLNINNSKLSNDGGLTNNDNLDVFGMTLWYDQQDGSLLNTAYHNGKLSAVEWMSKDGSGNKTYERAYKYTYDGINRYTASNYVERATASTGSFNNNVGGFDESGITYTAGGNILTLNRNSSTQGTNSNVQIDNLTYGYSTTNPNQLLTVTDVNDANHTGAGFRNYTGSSGSYTYDANGNLTADPYKGISFNPYNVLNRADIMTLTYGATGRYIKYTYNADGTLIRKQAYDNNTLGTTTDYIDGFVYVNSTLSYFSMPEGRVLYSGTTFTQEFIIADQQGNARVSFQDNGSGVAVVKQENSYYGFGLALLNSPVGLPTVPNKHLYNGGSEWQNDYTNLPDYYQTFNRNYDAALGRFIGVDPKAESAESMTSYQYAGNNPIMYNDPLGDAIKQVDLPVGYGPSSSSSFSGDWAQFQLENSAYNFVYGGGDSYGLVSDVGYNVYQNTYNGPGASVNDASFGTIGNAIATIYNMTGQLPGSNYSASAGKISYSYDTYKTIPAESNTQGYGIETIHHSGTIDAYAGDDGNPPVYRLAKHFKEGIEMDNTPFVALFPVLRIFKSVAGILGSVQSAEDALQNIRNLKELKYIRDLLDKTDTYHNFPYSFDKFIIENAPWAQRLKDGANWFEYPGSVNGEQGVYRIGINDDGVIFHRDFITK